MYHYFTPHPEELFDESVASTSTGIFGNLFSRIFKPSKYITIANNARDTTIMSISSSESFKTFDPPRHDDVGKVSDISMGKAFILTRFLQNEIGENSKEKNKNGSDILEQRKRSYIRFASIFEGRNPGLLDYKRLSLLKSNFRHYWMQDSSGRECYECQERFIAFKRRHHCRLCGQIFCSKCCSIQTESKLEDEPSSSAFDQKLNYETDVSVSTIFQGSVSWSLNSSVTAIENNENGTLFQCAVLRKSSVKLDSYSAFGNRISQI
uniref:FYVE-type domain-containing protein n=1 Tax=Wuchereria bancrofti TaxID=6293 RepID=A0A1I8EBH7_WUCBA